MHKNSSLILPGLVDVHVHLREPGATQKEDFESGSKAAIAGGYTQIIDMPNNNPPTTTLHALEEKTRLAKNKIWCDVGFNFGATKQSIGYFKAVYKKVFGLKAYLGKTTGPLLIQKKEDKDSIFKHWQSPMPIMVHVNGKDIIEIIELAKKYKRRIHICHITSDQITYIKKAKNEGIKLTCEVTPHHLFLDKNDMSKLGPFGLMKPPLSQNNPDILWKNIDIIDMIATDHAPHTISEKKGKNPVFGVPGLETTLPLMLQAVQLKKLSLKKLTEMLSVNPRNIFHLPNQKNTYLEVNISKTYKLKEKKLYTKCGWTPFGELSGRGELIKVVLRNVVIFENGNFLNRPRGKIIYPQLT